MLLSKARLANMLGVSALAAGVLATSAGASAGTATTSFQVTANVINACIITSNPLAFTNYDPTASAVNTATSTLSLACTAGSAPVVTLNAGQNAVSKIRTMVDGTAGDTALQYNLYQPTAVGTTATCSTTLWGDGSTTAGTSFVPSAPTNPLPRTLQVCGSLPINQSVKMGSTYTDSVLATVTF